MRLKGSRSQCENLSMQPHGFLAEWQRNLYKMQRFSLDHAGITTSSRLRSVLSMFLPQVNS